MKRKVSTLHGLVLILGVFALALFGIAQTAKAQERDVLDDARAKIENLRTEGTTAEQSEAPDAAERGVDRMDENAPDRQEREMRFRTVETGTEQTESRSAQPAIVENARDHMRMKLSESRVAFTNASGTRAAMVAEKRERLAELKSQRQQELQERLEERRAEITDRIRDRVHAYLVRVLDRFEAALERLDTLADRLTSRIEKLEEEHDITLDTAREALRTARAEIQNARESLAVIAEEARETLASSDDPRAAMLAIKELLRGSAEGVRNAHAALVEALRATKAALGLEEEEGADAETDDEDGDDAEN